MLQSFSLALALSAVALGQQPQNPTPGAPTPLVQSGLAKLIPPIGLGTARISRDNTSEVIAKAIENGYRHFDCAYIYGNQKEVGIGIKEGLKRTGLDRSALWITGKLWNDRHTRAEVALKESLDQLQLQYLDLFLIHWPHNNGDFRESFDHVETWKAMQKLVRSDMTHGTRFIGVSNFGPKQIDDIFALPGAKPEFHEFETHPYLPQEAWVQENIKRNMTVLAYSPLGNTQNNMNMGVSVDRNAVPQLLKTDIITSIAKTRNCTPAQVVLAWNLKRNVVVIPKAAQSAHQRENLATMKDCHITDQDVMRIKEIPQRIRFYPQTCTYMLEEGCEMSKKHSIQGKGKGRARF